MAYLRNVLLVGMVSIFPALTSGWAVEGASDRLSCDEPSEGHAEARLPAPDLYCITLHAAPAASGASGRVHLLPAETPFGVAVDRDGVDRQRFRVEVEGLPDPAKLGPYDRYVAWLTPPSFWPMVHLGEVENGVRELGEGGFNTFLILVSAEGPEVGDARSGPLVLRGASASMVLRPHDLPYILAEMSAEGETRGHEMHAPHTEHPPEAAHPDPDSLPPFAPVHLGHGLGVHDPGRAAASPWNPPPMHPQVDMPEAMMRLRPRVEPFLPRGGSGAHVPLARPREQVFLAHGDTLELEAGPVVRRIGGQEIPGYGFNQQIPGPLIRAEQGSTVHVRFRNETPLPSAVHWHGIRLENPYDGVPGVTQDPVSPGSEFRYELRLPDEGTYWYHPHLREDVMQDMGLSGNLQVDVPANGGNPYGAVDGEEILLLDDHLVGPMGPVPYGREAPIHALMGRFGNVLTVNGEEGWETSVRAGDVVRFHFTNAANTRTFNLSFGELPMKLVAGDLGKVPQELWVESVVVAPAERWVVEVRFPEEGSVAVENRVQALDHMGARFFSEIDTVGVVHVEGGRPAAAVEASAEEFGSLREAPGVRAEVEGLVEEHLHRDPDRTLLLDLEVGELPFPLNPLFSWEGVFRPRVEWAGTMPDMDWLVSGADVRWVLRDPDQGSENMEMDWRFSVGDVVKVEVVNDRNSLHAMQHPVHVHGQRFLVLSVNGERNPYPTWKDTALIPVGAVVELLVEMSNPGAWMVHCHIAEHLESGMMAVFHVDP